VKGEVQRWHFPLSPSRRDRPATAPIMSKRVSNRTNGRVQQQEVRIIRLPALQGHCSRRKNPVHGFGDALIRVRLGRLETPVLSLDTRSPPHAATVPTPEQTYDALAPDLKKKRWMRARAANWLRENTTAEMHQLQAQASARRSISSFSHPDRESASSRNVPRTLRMPVWSNPRPPTS